MKDESDFKPHMALIVYTNEKDDHYVESRDFIKNNEGEYRLGSGGPITKKAINQLSAIASSKKEVSCHSVNIIKSKILYFSFSKSEINLAWFIPEHRRKLNFKKDLGITEESFSLPSLIMFYQNGSLKIFAVKVKHNILLEYGNQCDLYRAPFLNMYVDGSVCMGNNSFNEESTDIQTLIDDVENKFFNSKFTHQIEEESIKGGLIEYLQKYKGERFDISLLIKHSKEIDDIWK